MEIVPIASLWLPIVLSAAFVFVASAIAWMVLPHHKSDWNRLPDESAARDALKGVAPGQYTVPYAATSAEWKSDEWKKKAVEGPNAYLTVIPTGLPNMSKSLGLWFVYCLVVSIFIAYLTGRTVAAGAEYLRVFRVAGATAFLAFGAAHVTNSIWFGRRWATTMKDLLDAFVYALLVAGVFGWLWP